MVFIQTGEASDRTCKRRKQNDGSHSPLRNNVSPNRDQCEATVRNPVRRPRVERVRKQKIMSKLSDSGFEDDFLTPTPTTSSDWTPQGSLTDALPPRSSNTLLSNWYHHYGEIGFRIQKLKETHFHPVNCLARQPQVTAESRCKLVSWLIRVHRHLRLSFECCCLAVNIMDRFLTSNPVASDCFQLLGITSLLLASKQVEVFSPRVNQLLSLCCNAFSREQLCNLECIILLRLNFRLDTPTIAFFLDFYNNRSLAGRLVGGERISHRLTEDEEDVKRRCRDRGLALRVCELTLADYAFNKYTPSLTARCALDLANHLLKNNQGSEMPVSQLPRCSKENTMNQSLTEELTCAPSQENQQEQRSKSESDPAHSENGHSHHIMAETKSDSCSSLSGAGHFTSVNASTQSGEHLSPSGNTSSLVGGDQAQAPLMQECGNRDQTHVSPVQECKGGNQTHVSPVQECKGGNQTHASPVQECKGGNQINASPVQECKGGNQTHVSPVQECKGGNQTHASPVQECKGGNQTHVSPVQECKGGNQTHALFDQECKEGDQTHALYMECFENLRQLVSLNQDALQAMMTL